MSEPLRLGVLGGRSWILQVAILPALDLIDEVELVALGAATGAVGEGIDDPALRATLVAADRGSYEAVLADAEVEAVYLPLPNDLHLPWVTRALEAGKHVLCEKPLGLTADEVVRMHATAEAAGLVLAEAWMTPFSPRWRASIEAAERGEVGAVRHVRTEFTFPLGPEKRTNYRFAPEHGGGSLYDVGIYALGPALRLLGDDPAGIEVLVDRDPTGVDLTTVVLLDHGDGRVASAMTSFGLPDRQLLEITGTEGRIVVDTVAHTNPTGAPAPRLERHGEAPRALTYDDFDPYARMLQAFHAAVRGDAPWPRPASDEVALARVVDRVRERGGARA
jgi:predicted dehydrogenase